MAQKNRQPRSFTECQRRYGELTRALAEVGFVWPGTVQRRMLTCGKPKCICHRDPQSRHGPYYYWTSKKEGKTVSRQLTPEEAAILESWIENRRKVDDTLKRMTRISERALVLQLRALSKSR
jgi:hypothetical protein